LEDDEFNEKTKAIASIILDMLDKKIIGYADNERLMELRKEVNDLMENEFKSKGELNREMSRNKCANILQKFTN